MTNSDATTSSDGTTDTDDAIAAGNTADTEDTSDDDSDGAGTSDTSAGGGGGSESPGEGAALGQACAEDDECASDSCADGVCCDAACDEVCAACDLAGQLGQCSAPDHDAECPALACPPDTDCRVHVSDDSETNCVAIGECLSGATCDLQNQPVGTACQDGNGSCDDSGECVVAGKLTLGEACDDDDECGSDYCVTAEDGTTRCCESACDGVCAACDADGRCAATPNDDPDCDDVTCPQDTPCTTYPDPLTTNRCSGFGACTNSAAYCQPNHLSDGTACGTGLVCDGEGECESACSASQLWCDGGCIDPMSNGAHCGGCNTPCQAPLMCNQGTCSLSCPGSQVACGTNCINPLTNATYCGASGDCMDANAGETCTPPYTCENGTCELVCTGGEVNCNYSCVNPQTDDYFCGASGNCTGGNQGQPCDSNEACVAGVCRLQCPGSQVPCNGTCIDPNTEDAYCGATNFCEGNDNGEVCGPGEQCVGGSCELEGECTTTDTSQCPSGRPYCVANQCRPCNGTCEVGGSCSEADDCGSNICTSGTCRPTCTGSCSIGDRCSVTDDCSGLNVCLGGACVECGSDADCASSGEYCSGNVCRPCRDSNNALCELGEQCLVDTCSEVVEACSTSNDCQWPGPDYFTVCSNELCMYGPGAVSDCPPAPSGWSHVYYLNSDDIFEYFAGVPMCLLACTGTCPSGYGCEFRDTTNSDGTTSTVRVCWPNHFD